MKKLLSVLILPIMLVGLAACGQAGEQMEQSRMANYENITAQSAKEIMSTESDYVILDVRTSEEFAEGHIKGAVLLPDYEIEAKAEDVLPDKDKLILVYCRSGRRSKLAAEKLLKLGYTNIKEFGGIIDWPYEIVK